MYNEGISTAGDIIDLGLEHGVITKAGAWFSYQHPTNEAIRLGQGREAVRALLNENPTLSLEIESLIREIQNPVKIEESQSAETSAETSTAKSGKTKAAAK